MVITCSLGELMVDQIFRYYFIVLTINDRVVIYIYIYTYIIYVNNSNCDS